MAAASAFRVWYSNNCSIETATPSPPHEQRVERSAEESPPKSKKFELASIGLDTEHASPHRAQSRFDVITRIVSPTSLLLSMPR